MKIATVLQSYKIHLVNGEVIDFFEDYDIPYEDGICGRFEKADEKDVLSFGDLFVGFYVPKRSILYITAGDVIDRRAEFGEE